MAEQQPEPDKAPTHEESLAKPKVTVRSGEVRPLLQPHQIERSLLSGYDDRW